VLVHSGQHYDYELSAVFFEELGMREPDVNLNVGSGKHGYQTALILERLEPILDRKVTSSEPFDRVVVVGDVNSTMAAALASVKLGIPVAHVEAGLRSFDRSMPEEINRIVTDSVSDMLFASEPAAVENLRREGHTGEHIHLVGNVMIDTLRRLLEQARSRDTLERFRLQPREYGVITLHRPSNVDCRESLEPLIGVLADVSRELPLVFPIHPRTRTRLERFGLAGRLVAQRNIITTPPLSYLDFLALTSQAKLIVTDSGGLQEESTALGIPCLTARFNTERPVTVEEGTSTLVGNDPEKLRAGLALVLSGRYKHGRCPDLWDGHAAERIASILERDGKNSPYRGD
jgi:UDP-N-acetylglucosamine 2-epimerase (non-hydrolysing)